jgi:hypothetical protein
MSASVLRSVKGHPGAGSPGTRASKTALPQKSPTFGSSDGLNMEHRALAASANCREFNEVSPESKTAPRADPALPLPSTHRQRLRRPVGLSLVVPSCYTLSQSLVGARRYRAGLVCSPITTQETRPERPPRRSGSSLSGATRDQYPNPSCALYPHPCSVG